MSSSATTLNVVQPSPDTFSLDTLASGHCAIVCEIDASNGDLQRLQVMGVCVGRRIAVVKRGDPMIVRVLGARLGLSLELARQVRVTPVDRKPCCQSHA